jgi:SPP1 family predicted phage head-tail adaptor
MSTTAATARINAGLLTQRIELQSRAAGQDVLGQASGAWSTVATVWARARPLRSRELFAAGTVQNVTDVEFAIRWRADVRSTWRILWRGVAYEITGEPIDVDGQQQWLEILGASDVRNAR